MIGQALCRKLTEYGAQVTVLSRQPERVPELCANARGIATLQEITSVDAVINLAGAPIADRPWTKARRALLWQSRVDATHALITWIQQLKQRPSVLVSASATGWYGNCEGRIVNENSAQQSEDFASRLCDAWEKAAQQADALGVRAACIRIAPVLADSGGMLARMLPIFRLGLGGKIGNGKQWMPWIHQDDIVRLFLHVLHTPNCRGIYNGCSPNRIRNDEFTRALARTLNRPAFLPVPAWLLRATLGEMSSLLLASQQVLPARTADSGFAWQHPDIEPALKQLLTQ